MNKNLEHTIEKKLLIMVIVLHQWWTSWKNWSSTKRVIVRKEVLF